MIPIQPPMMPGDSAPAEVQSERDFVRGSAFEALPFPGFACELQTFERHKAELLGNEGQYVVIQGDDVAGTWPTYEEALEAGYTRFGLDHFLVKRILKVDPVIHLPWVFPTHA